LRFRAVFRGRGRYFAAQPFALYTAWRESRGAVVVNAGMAYQTIQVYTFNKLLEIDGGMISGNHGRVYRMRSQALPVCERMKIYNDLQA
jgi:hypothetical protein